TGFKDVVAFSEVADMSGNPAINFQTAPTKDDGFLAAGETRLNPVVGVNTTILRYEGAGLPITRYLRWRLGNAGAAWSITFRIWLSCNMSGNYSRLMTRRQRALQGRRAEDAKVQAALRALNGQLGSKGSSCRCKGGGGCGGGSCACSNGG